MTTKRKCKICGADLFVQVKIDHAPEYKQAAAGFACPNQDDDRHQAAAKAHQPN